MESAKSPAPDRQNQLKIRVKYDQLSATYASQVLLNNTPDEVFIDFSSGTITDPGSGEALLPVHTRIAMTHAGAHRLLKALEQSLNRPQGQNPPAAPRKG